MDMLPSEALIGWKAVKVLEVQWQYSHNYWFLQSFLFQLVLEVGPSNLPKMVQMMDQQLRMRKPRHFHDEQNDGEESSLIGSNGRPGGYVGILNLQTRNPFWSCSRLKPIVMQSKIQRERQVTKKL